MSTGLTDRRREAAKRLLQLLGRDEIETLSRNLALSSESGIDTIIQELGELPRFKALQVLLKAAEPTVLMLQDITSFLERHGISARTTGFTLALADPSRPASRNRIDLSSQEVAQVCSWSSKRLHVLGDDPFQETYDQWRSLIRDWNSLLSRSRPHTIRGEIDAVRTYINIKRGIPEIEYEPDRDLTDYEAQRVLRHLLDKVNGLAEILERIRQEDRTSSIDPFIRDIRELLRAAEREVFQTRSSYRSVSRSSRERELDERTMLRYVSDEFLDTFDRISEDLRAIADLSEDEEILDILRVDLWSSRPQLYEVWLLTCLLAWIRSRGHRVDLLQLDPGEDGRIVWCLSYARESQPCAQIVYEGSSSFVFFQLYRPSGDMPDLCLLSDSWPDAKPIWAIDAKHSERGGYRLTSYRDTALRYRDSFGASLSLVVEYFPRIDLSFENPTEFGAGAALVRDARPNGTGMAFVLELLAAIHPQNETIVVCVDFSSSFKERRKQAFQEAVKKLRSLEGRVLDTYICFAGDAIAVEGMKTFLRAEQQTQLPEPNVQDGTSVEGIIRHLKRIATSTTVTRIMVISDGQFSESGWLDHIEQEVGCSVELCSY